MRARARNSQGAHARPGRARARPPPDGPRACELAARRDVVLVAALVLAPLTLLRELPNAYDTDAFYAPFAAFLHDRLSHGDCRSGTRSRSRASRSPPIRSRACSTRRRSSPTGCSRRRPAWSLLVTFHYLLATLSSYSFARLLGAGRLGAVYAGLAFGVSRLPARALAGARPADGRGLARGRAWPPRNTPCDARGAGASPLVARRRARALDPRRLAAADRGRRDRRARRARAAAALARASPIFAGAGVAALGLAAVALLPRLELVVALDGSERRGRPGRRRHARLVRRDADVRLVRVEHGRARSALRGRADARAVVRRARPPLAARRALPAALGVVAIAWSVGLAG